MAPEVRPNIATPERPSIGIFDERICEVLFHIPSLSNAKTKDPFSGRLKGNDGAGGIWGIGNDVSP